MTKKSLGKDVIKTLKKYTFGPTHDAWLDPYTFCMKTYGIPSNIFVTAIYEKVGEEQKYIQLLNFILHPPPSRKQPYKLYKKCYSGYDIFSLFSLALFYYFIVILYPYYLSCSFDIHACTYSCTHKYIRVYYYYNFVFFTLFASVD